MIRPLDVGIAAFAVDERGPVTVETQPGPRIRGASVVKPLLAWVAAGAGPFATARQDWECLARDAITTSDNEATATLWSDAGPSHLLAELERRTGVVWRPEGEGEHPSLRLLVTAAEVARAYAIFAGDRGDRARDVRRWMRDVRTDQTFGLRTVAAGVLGVPEGHVGVKGGWFGGERVHAVVLVEHEDRAVGGVVTSTWRPDPVTHAACLAARGDDTALVAVHEQLAGGVLRKAMHEALLAANC